MHYRLLTTDDTAVLARIHNEAFHNFFLTDLGPFFLKTYYQAVIISTRSIAVCCVNDSNEVIAFATGCELSKGYNRRIVLNNFLGFSLQFIRLIFTKPGAVIRLLKNFEKNANPIDDGNYAELLSIAVLPEYKGLSIGKSMIEVFEREAQQRGCRSITLTTDFYNNDSVIEFYKKRGYCIFL